jgi:hypothetical protein
MWCQCLNEDDMKTIYDLVIEAEFTEEDMTKRKDNFLRLVDLIVLECALVVRNEGRFMKYDKLAERVKARFMVK